MATMTLPARKSCNVAQVSCFCGRRMQGLSEEGSFKNKIDRLGRVLRLCRLGNNLKKTFLALFHSRRDCHISLSCKHYER